MLKKIQTKRFFESPDGDNYYFGYFDTPQVSMDDSKILGIKCNSIDRVPDPEKGDIADVQTPGGIIQFEIVEISR